MRSIVYLCVALVCLYISACVPEIGSYYSPSGAIGVPVSEYCHGSIGAKNSMKIEIDGTELILSADEIGNSKIHIDLQMLGNSGSYAKFDPDKISIYDEDKSETLGKKDIKRTNSKVQPHYSAYSFDINAAPVKFLVIFPPITSRERSYDRIIVHFTKKHGAWLGALNC